MIIVLMSISLVAQKVCINNFNQNVCKNFTALNAIIIKSPLSKKALKSKLNRPLKQLAFLQDANLFLLDSNDSLNEAKALAKHPYILYAQPDMMQNKEFAKRTPTDIITEYNLKFLWKQTKGEGVKIAIIDDGFNLEHEDLKDIHLHFAYDADHKNLNASPKVKLDHHGTAVAGIIFASHNGLGIDGIAPNAKLIAIRQTTNKTSDTVLSFTVAQKAGADIINCSWNSPMLLEPIYDVIVDIAQNGREGRGVAIVFAAGNNAKEIKPNSIEASIDEVITVGSYAKSSNFGKIVDFKLKSNIVSLKGSGYGNFGGTSAVAPVVSGLLALYLAQEPNTKMSKLVTKLKKYLAKREKNAKKL